jgi:hypothetical protein
MTEEQKIKRLNLMRYWLFGTFVIVFAALITYTGMLGIGMQSLLVGPTVIGIPTPIWAIVGVLCIVTYYGYKFLYIKNVPTA